MNSYESLLAKISLVRRRWRLQVMARGISLFLVCAVTLLVLGIWGADLFGFRPPAVWAMRLLTGSALVFVAWYFLYVPLRARLTDVRIARFVEESSPELQDRLVAAVEYGKTEGSSSSIIGLLIRDALDKTSHVDFSMFLNRRRLASFLVIGCSSLLVLLALLNWGPSFFSYGFGRLYVPWTEASRIAPMLIEIYPADIEIARGSDQQVEARLIGFDSPDVRLYVRPESSEMWDSSQMEADPRGSGFSYLLVDLKSSLRYYVGARGVRSRTGSIKVIDLPRVEKIDLTYNFPPYTGMAPQVVEDEGDISALKGTKVDLRIHLSRPAESARLLFDDKSTLDLTRAGAQDFTGTIPLRRSGSYVVQVSDNRRRNRPGSPEYRIEAIEDEPPKVTVLRPMRDVRATSVEEVFSEIKGEDDIGMGTLELFYSVNGGEEKRVNLHRGKTGQTSISGSHTFFLEEFGLEPGDLISYYAKASDNNNVTGPGVANSDIYFIQVRPFEQNYTQEQGGMPGGGQNEENQEALSRQQKEIIAATFRLIREQKRMPEKEFLDGLKALALVQSRLQGQAQGLVDRLQRRGAGQVDDTFRKLSEYLEGAVVEMGAAAATLGARKPEEAMPSEQKALQQLMRAESLFRDIQVSFSSQNQGGSGSQANAEDLADLFELELNKLKNQYETVQRGEQRERDQKVDEALERLKELARRQQQLNERNRMMAQQGTPSSSGGGGGTQNQQQLLQEAEELQRQLQRLSRQRSSRQLNEAGNRLEKAIEEMKRALKGSQKGNHNEAGAQGTRALQQIEDAARRLERGRETDFRQELDRVAEESGRILEEQGRIEEGIERLARERGQSGSEAAGRELREELMERKSLLADRLRNLENQARDLSRQAGNSRKETGGELGGAADAIRDKRLPERIQGGNAQIRSGDYERQKADENTIREGLEEVNRRLQSAQGSLAQGKEGKLEDAANRARQLAEGLESMQQRMNRGNARQGQEQNTERGSAGEPEPRGRPGSDADVRSLSGNATGAPSGFGPHRNEDERQLSRELQQRAADAQELRRLLDRNSTQVQNLDKVIESLRKAGNSQNAGDPGQIESLRKAIDHMRRVEFDLARDLEQLNRKDKYFFAEDNEAPAGYRKLVEEYYKAIAKGK